MFVKLEIWECLSQVADDREGHELIVCLLEKLQQLPVELQLGMCYPSAT